MSCTPPTHQRLPSYPKRHASFDSPREVPLPSPSLLASLSPGGSGAQYFSSRFPHFSPSGTTPSTSTTTTAHMTKLSGSTFRKDVYSDYFPTQPRTVSSSGHNQGQSSSSSSSSSSARSGSSTSSQSRNSDERFPVFEEEMGSDWTSQTSVSSSPKTDDPVPPGPTAAIPGSASDRRHTRTSSSDLGTQTAISGTNPGTAMTMMASQPPATAAAPTLRTTTIATPIFPYTRPYSLPYSDSPAPPSRMPTYSQTRPQSPSPESMLTPQWPDRSSSASLPLPAQVPFHTLPRAAPASAGGTQEASGIGGLGAGLGRIKLGNREARDAGDAHAERVRQAHKSEVGEQWNYRRSYHEPRDNNPYGSHLPTTGPSSSSNTSSSSSADDVNSVPAQRALSPANSTTLRATAPPSPVHPPPRPSTSQSYTSPSAALARSQSQTHHHHTHSNTQFGQLLGHSNSQSHMHPQLRSQSPGPAYPAPEPPTILSSATSPSPFLSHAPPPPDSWIQVETLQCEYRLIVRLPGFRRDGITLATKRRRVLHVVADCWENGGGVFAFSLLYLLSTVLIFFSSFFA
ncbi:hypothetical protein H0H81_002087 [Sphagnurus paluster]|uniref:SHSP domain-containing protein n=1 Tax=Sphagnurus paluster TaxID=117069 RepID=A0A9P7K5S5_9AGAR|nr:hypothetical protein H0H81_002087 [Sphagnurus paluster]